ncbi:hypothetical protein [Streptomyces sp. NPDC096351]|uniref:hypothetical protein n=1 Tax=Streptomyces sp. NPDC096351 TaxID=3366087 RepID=UPI003821B07A
MRFARYTITLLIAFGLPVIGLHLAPLIAQATTLSQIQAGMATGVLVTLAAFQSVGLLHRPEPAADRKTL